MMEMGLICRERAVPRAEDRWVHSTGEQEGEGKRHFASKQARFHLRGGHQWLGHGCMGIGMGMGQMAMGALH